MEILHLIVAIVLFTLLIFSGVLAVKSYRELRDLRKKLGIYGSKYVKNQPRK